MSNRKNLYIRILLLIALVAMLFFMPTREFLKVTFMLGVPFVFLLIWMSRQPRLSITWSLCGLGLLVVVGFYGYTLIHLPERIQVREIVSSGAFLVAQGEFDEAIAKYEQLEDLGEPQRMKKSIAFAEKEKNAHGQLERARQLIDSGKREEAVKILETIPADTRAYQQSRSLLKSIE